MLVETDGETVFSSWRVSHRNGKLLAERSARAGSQQYTIQISNSAQRLSRVTGKPKAFVGRIEFLRVSWDEALNLIHQQHKRIREAYDPASIFAGSYGWRSNGVLHKASTLYNAIWRWQAVISGIWGYSTGRHRRSCRMSWVARSLSTANQLAAGAGT
ncbi:molybdopterin-dependent oxidoreductase [Escherichia coli]